MRNTDMHLLSLPAALALCACNTLQATGKELKQGGAAIERAAKH